MLSCIAPNVPIVSKHIVAQTWMFSFESWIESHLALFNASFETNPLDGKCDQKAKVTAQPVKLVYDAVSIKIFHSICTENKFIT